MPVKRILSSGKVPVKIYTEDIDNGSLNQLEQLSTMPFIHSHIAAMPDVHQGIGAAVGTVIPTIDAIIPAAVGVDIGCGMNALRLSLSAHELPDSLEKLRHEIERNVPVGSGAHKSPVVTESEISSLQTRLAHTVHKHPELQKMHKNFHHAWRRQLATLGGGNHFIEICVDEKNQVWIMLHSGSRGIGNCIGRHFIALAKKEIEAQTIQPPHKDLAYFKEGSRHFDDYTEAIAWAQDYAACNRREMMKLVMTAMRGVMPDFSVTDGAISCHHNYVNPEHHFGQDVYVTRKGAIRAGRGEMGIIPGSMGAQSYIVRGKGSAESFNSSAHGAGRRMSRSKARMRYKVSDLAAQTSGVECRKDKGVLDEIPSAYKSVAHVMANQTDLVDVVHTLKQVVCVKG